MIIENPAKIQFVPKNQAKSKIPLVLIHDGGGTTFAYYCLESLQRDVYAIHDPKYESEETWKGGMEEMARTYIELLKDAGIQGPIILGGWSLGGLLSLEIAHLLLLADPTEKTQRIFVQGILLIDTTFHVPWSKYAQVRKTELPSMPKLTRQSLDKCEGLLDTWELPSWDQNASISLNKPVQSCHSRYANIPPGHIYYQTVTGEGSEIPISRDGMPLFLQNSRAMVGISEEAETQLTNYCTKPPPAVLIRAVEKLPDKSQTGLPVRIDLFRDNMVLGWEFSKPDFIKGVIDVQANHYDMFAFSKAEVLTMRVNQALEVLGY